MYRIEVYSLLLCFVSIGSAAFFIQCHFLLFVHVLTKCIAVLLFFFFNEFVAAYKFFLLLLSMQVNACRINAMSFQSM